MDTTNKGEAETTEMGITLTEKAVVQRTNLKTTDQNISKDKQNEICNTTLKTLILTF